MAGEDIRDDDAVEHRPLPSVDMDLLPEQRRATRVKQLTGMVVLGLGVLGGVTGAIIHYLVSAEEGEADAAAPKDEGSQAAVAAGADDAGTRAASTSAAPSDAGMAAAEPAAERAVTRETAKFGSARGFRDALRKAGLDKKRAVELEDALEGVLDFTNCRPEDRMIFERAPSGRIVLFEYHGGPTDVVRVERRKGQLEAEKVEVPVETVRRARGGTIDKSLGNALERIGLGRKMVRPFLGVFAARIDFSRETRTGDTFKIIVDEKRMEGEFLRYGRVHALEYSGERTGTVRAFWYEPEQGEGEYYDEDGRAMTGWLKPPCRYDQISSRFDRDRMHPILKRPVPHLGVDYAAGRGTPIWAAADGKVTFAGDKGANGNLVSIRHDNGYKTHYAHLSRIAEGIEPGTRVEQREVIGYMGSTGRSTGPHLHFGLKKGGRYVDPLEEFNGPGPRCPARYRKGLERRTRKLKKELESIELGAPE